MHRLRPASRTRSGGQTHQEQDRAWAPRAARAVSTRPQPG